MTLVKFLGCILHGLRLDLISYLNVLIELGPPDNDLIFCIIVLKRELLRLDVLHLRFTVTAAPTIDLDEFVIGQVEVDLLSSHQELWFFFRDGF